VCVPCPAGLIAASNGLSVCTPCAIGSIAATDGLSVCSPCAPNTIAATTGLFTCTPCAPGTTAANAGSSVCSVCPLETYKPSQDSSVCLGCTSNCSISQHAEVQCTASTNRVCCDRYVVWETLYTFACLLWMLWVLCMIMSSVVADIWTDDLNLTYAMDGLYESLEDPPTLENLRPMDWPEYTTTLLWDTKEKLTSSELFVIDIIQNKTIQKISAQAVCGSTCTKGFFWDYTYYTSKGVQYQNCKECNYGQPDGYYKGSTCPYDGMCSNDRIPCPAGLFTDNIVSETCVPCFAGSYSSSTSSTMCLQCPIGKYNLGPNFKVVPYIVMTACETCPTNYTSFEGASSCFQCVAGKFNDNNPKEPCIDCYPGTYSSVLSMSACSTCPTGTFMTSYGATMCGSCDQNCPLSQFMQFQCDPTNNVKCCTRYIAFHTLNMPTRSC
jgi:hypothetical protein